MSIHITPAQQQRLTALAAATSRTADELVQEGLERYLAYQEDLLATIKRGRADIAAGRVVEADEVVARLERILQAS